MLLVACQLSVTPPVVTLPVACMELATPLLTDAWSEQRVSHTGGYEHTVTPPIAYYWACETCPCHGYFEKKNTSGVD